MTNPNARDLIRRLADELDAWVMAHSLGGKPPETQYSIELVLQAHAYLAQPEPAAGPTLDDILELCAEHEFMLGIDGANEEESANGLLEIARAVLTRWGNHAPQLLPAKPRSADHIVNDDGIPWYQTKNALLWAQAFGALFPEMAPHEDLMLSWFANAIETGCNHEHWKLAAERTPIPLSERLPGSEDCDAEGKCWWSHDESCDDPWKDGSLPFDPKWILRVDGPTSSAWAERTNRHVPCVHPTHWLPHWAIPVPQEEGR